MAVVGDAYVVVRAITNKVRDDIQKAFRDARPAIASEGRSAGQEFASNFQSGLGDKINSSVRDALSGASQAASQSGQDAGSNFASNFESGVGNIDGSSAGRQYGQSFAQAANSTSGNAMGNLGGNAERQAGDAGGRAGNAFSRALDSGFAKASIKASEKLTGLIAAGNLLGPMLAGVAGGASAAVSGLFAMGAAAGQAAGAFAVLPGMISVAVQSMASIKLAFGGVGDAVSAGMAAVPAAAKPSNEAMKAAAEAARAAADAVEDAQEGVADAALALSRAQQDAARRVRDAQAGIADAHREAAEAIGDAQQDVADAHEAAAEAIADAQRGVRDAQRSTARAVEDARESVRDAYRDAARAATDSARAVADAEEEVRDAQVEVLQAQRELNVARAEAAEQLQQLGFDAEGAALAEERAAMKLEEAHAALVATQSLPPDDAARREAEIAYRETELAYRQAKDRNADLTKEQRAAAKAGIEGSDEVIAARQRVNDANERLGDSEGSLREQRIDARRQAVDSANAIADAEENLRETQVDGARAVRDALRDLAEAREEGAESIADAEENLGDVRADAARNIADANQNLADVRVQNARSIRDAQDNLADAQERLREAQAARNKALRDAKNATDDASTATDAYAQAMRDLSPEARKFVRYLVSIQDEIDGLRAAAGKELFPKLTTALRSIVENLFPVLRRNLRVTGGLLGDMAIDFSDTVSKGEGLRRIGNIMRGNNSILRVFTREGKDGKSAINDMTIVALRLLEAIQPLTRRFARWIAHLADMAEKSTRGEKGMDRLRGFFKRAGDTAAQLGRIIGNLIGTVMNLGGAARPAGQDLLDSFEKATQKLEEMTEVGSKKGGGLRRYFRRVSANLKDIGDLANTIGFEFFKLGDNRGIGKMAKSFEPAVKNIGDILDELANSGPLLGELATEITRIIEALTKSGATEWFLKTLTGVARMIRRIVDNPIAAGFLAAVGPVYGVIRAFSFLLKPAKFLFMALVGGPLSLLKAFSKLGRGLGALKAGKGLSGALAAMRSSSNKTVGALQKQMGVDKQKVASLKAVETQALRTAAALQRTAGAAAAGTAGAGAAAAAPAAGAAAAPAAAAAGTHKATTRMSRFGSVAGKVAKGPLKLLTGGFKLMGRALMTGLGPLGLILIAGYALFKFFQALYKKSPEFRKFIDGIVEKVKVLGDWFKKIFNQYVLPAMNRFFGWLNDKGPAIKKFFTTAGKVIWGAIKIITWPIRKLVEVAMWAWDKLFGNSVFPDMIDGFKDFFGWVGKIFNGVKNIISKVIGAIIGFVKRNWDILLGILLGPIGILVVLIRRNWDKIKAAFFIAVRKIKGFIIGFRDAVRNIFDKIGEKFSAFGRWLKERLWEPVKRAVGRIKEFFGDLWDRIKQIFGFIWGKYMDFNRWLREKIINAVKTAVDKVKGFFGGLWDRVKQIFGWIGDKFGQFKDWITKRVKDVVSTVVGRVKEFFGGLWDRVKQIFGWIGDKFGDFKDWITTRVRDVVLTVVGKVKDFFGGLWDKIKDVFEKIGEKFGTFRTKLGEIKDWVKDKVGDIKDFFTGIPGALGRAFGRLANVARGPLNSFIRFMNNSVIDNINKVTEKFGLTIPKIPTVPAFEEGGYTGPGDKKKVAGIVHADEFVLRSKARRKIEATRPGLLDRANKTGELPMGDLGDFVGGIGSAVGGALGDAWDSVESLAKKGVGKTLEILIDGARGLMETFGIKKDNFLGKWFYKIMEKLSTVAANWGGDKDDEIKQRSLRIGGNVNVELPANARGLRNWTGGAGGTGTFTRLFVEHLKAAQKLAGVGIYVTQGGWRPETSYSGTSHRGDAIDLQVSTALLKALRRVGIAAGDRTGLGSWSPHIHAVPSPRSGVARGSARWQWTDYVAKGGKNQSARSPWGLAKGGIVHATPGGILAQIGEAGRNERVEPLNQRGMSKRDEEILKAVRESRRGGDTFNIYPSKGMNESELAAMVSRRVAFKKRVGT